MRFSPFHKLIMTAAAVLIAVGILLVVTITLMQKTDELRFTITQTKEAITSAESQRTRMGVFSRMLEERQEDFRRINNYFIDSKRPVTFIETLEGLAKETGNKISLSVGSASISRGEFTFSLEVDGTERSVTKYLKLIELLPHELFVENFNFTLRSTQLPPKDTTAERTALLSASIRVKTAN